MHLFVVFNQSSWGPEGDFTSITAVLTWAQVLLQVACQLLGQMAVLTTEGTVQHHTPYGSKM